MLTTKRPPQPTSEERRQRAAQALVGATLQPTGRAVMATAETIARGASAVQKERRHESEAWRRAVAALPCVLCQREGSTQAAHRNEGKGMGLKTDDALTAALCATCHSAIDQGPDFSREERRRRLDVAILLTIRQLARNGVLKIVRGGA